MNEKQQKPHSVFGFGFRPTVSVYSVSAKNFHFGASLIDRDLLPASDTIIKTVLLEHQEL